MHYPIETELGTIIGRDGIYVDEIHFNYSKRELQFIGEINGALCSGTNDDSFIKYSLEFQGVYIFNMIELDISHEFIDIEFGIASFIEIKKSKALEHAKKARNTKFKSYLLQTYDDVFEIVCEKYILKIQK